MAKITIKMNEYGGYYNQCSCGLVLVPGVHHECGSRPAVVAEPVKVALDEGDLYGDLVAESHDLAF